MTVALLRERSAGRFEKCRTTNLAVPGKVDIKLCGGVRSFGDLGEHWLSSSDKGTAMVLSFHNLWSLSILYNASSYTGCHVTGGIDGTVVILHEKLDQKYTITLFHTRLCF